MIKEHVFCDRCGKEIVLKGLSNRGFHLFPKHILCSVHDDSYYDLCQDCYNGLEHWFKSGKDKE